MATNDFKVVSSGPYSSVPTAKFQTAAGTTAINAGEPVMLTTIGTSVYAAVMTDAKPVIGTDFWCGLAKSAGTHTSAADGTVEVYLPLPGVVYRGKAKSSTAADTDAEILALANKRTIIDLTASTYTIDTAAADGATNGLILTGTGNSANNSVDFMVSVRATQLGF